MKELLKSLLGMAPGKYAGDEILAEGDPTEVAQAPAPKTAPTIGEINQWNKYLTFFNDKVKQDKITDESLDAGDGSYAKKLWEEYATQNKISSPYDETTKKMQDYYISLYNSKDPFAASLVKSNYPKPILSAVDGRVGSLTKNYYIPTMNYAKTIKDKNGDKTYSFKGVFNPFSEQGIDVVHNTMMDDHGQPMSNEGVTKFYKDYATQKASVKNKTP